MRRWTRDRSKRRKQQPNEPPAQDKPEPLQPRFPDAHEAMSDGGEPPKHEVRSANEPEPAEEHPAAEAGKDEAQIRSQRSRRRGRRGRGNRPQSQSQPPALPAPGGPTGEAAEAEAPSEAAEPIGGTADRQAPQPSKKIYHGGTRARKILSSSDFSLCPSVRFVVKRN